MNDIESQQDVALSILELGQDRRVLVSFSARNGKREIFSTLLHFPLSSTSLLLWIINDRRNLDEPFLPKYQTEPCQITKLPASVTLVRAKLIGVDLSLEIITTNQKVINAEFTSSQGGRFPLVVISEQDLAA